MEDKQKIPPGWSQDSLSEFIENAIHNTYATFHNLKPWYNLLKDIHLIFDKIVHNITGTQEWFSSFFLFRSHAAFSGAVRLALSGQVPEVYMVLRGCLENALYGLYLSRNPSSQETWLRRHDDDQSKEKLKREFTVRKLLNSLKSEDDHLYNIANDLYERTIDFGGHPNERAFLSVMKRNNDGSKITFDSAYLIGNELALQLSLKSCAQIGICALFIFRRIFRERFDILGLSQQLNDLKQGL